MTQKFHSWVHIKNKNTNLKRYVHLNAHNNVIYNFQDLEAA